MLGGGKRRNRNGTRKKWGAEAESLTWEKQQEVAHDSVLLRGEVEGDGVAHVDAVREAGRDEEADVQEQDRGEGGRDELRHLGLVLDGGNDARQTAGGKRKKGFKKRSRGLGGGG